MIVGASVVLFLINILYNIFTPGKYCVSYICEYRYSVLFHTKLLKIDRFEGGETLTFIYSDINNTSLLFQVHNTKMIFLLHIIIKVFLCIILYENKVIDYNKMCLILSSPLGLFYNSPFSASRFL